MFKSRGSSRSSTHSTSEDPSGERRKHWRDRRMMPDRRSPERQRQMDFDCRSGIPRRASDIGGELADGDIWWDEDDPQI